MIKCKNLSKGFNGKIKCKLYKKDINILLDCENCLKRNVVRNRDIRNKSNKQSKLEKSRFSIFTNNFNKCYYCKKEIQDEQKLDLHEVYGGSNRIRSIKNGFVIPLCRICHSDEKIIKYLREKLQKEYEKTHTREEFIKTIGKSYIKGDD